MNSIVPKSSFGASSAENAVEKLVMPVPEDVPAPDFAVRTAGKLAKVWAYRDQDQKLLMYVARYNKDQIEGNVSAKQGKEFRPYTLWQTGSAKPRWLMKSPPSLRPLYGLEGLGAAKSSDRLVIVAEGEKSADAASRLFPNAIALSPSGGSNATRHTDWSPLHGREVLITPDADEAGGKFAQSVAEQLLEAGAKSISLFDIASFGKTIWRDGIEVAREGSIVSGFDIADAEQEGWDSVRIESALRHRPGLVTEVNQRHVNEREMTEFGKFVVNKRGVFIRHEMIVQRGTTGESTDEWLCSPLEVIGRSRNKNGEGWGRVLKLQDPAGKTKTILLPNADFAGDGKEARKRLMSAGLDFTPTTRTRTLLTEYITSSRPEDNYTSVSQPGWHDSSFVLPECVISAGKNTKVLFDAEGMQHSYALSGDFHKWQNAARYAVGNSRFAVTLASAFVAPLLGPLDGESGGIHLRAKSGGGKTTIAKFAGSVWGGGGIEGYLRNWRATDNGLEAIAATHSDTFLALDEIGQADDQMVGKIIYMLSNGVGKARATETGAAKSVSAWRNFVLSTGEISIESKIETGGRGQQMTAGQSIRIVDINADAGAGMGVFENLHDFDTPHDLAKHLNDVARRNYGHASISFLEKLVNNLDDAKNAASKCIGDFKLRNCRADDDSQVLRVAERFGFIAAAGELAAAYGVLPWPAGEAVDAAAKCFADWRDLRGGGRSHEEITALKAVRDFIARHGTTRFQLFSSNKENNPNSEIEAIHNRAGFRQANETGEYTYYAFPETWAKDICNGLDSRLVADVMAKNGHLDLGENGRLSKKIRLPGMTNSVRCYVILPTFFADSSETSVK